MKNSIANLFRAFLLVGAFSATQLRAEDNPPDDLTVQLSKIEGLKYEEVKPSPNPAYRLFELRYKQPADHKDLTGPWFEQRLILWHRNASRPMVLQTSGYAIFGRELSTVASEFDANQIQVEHRFFEGSTPADKNWKLDTIEQSANDFHRVTQAFKSIYTAKWVNTGRSKGGMTSVYHRRFFPNDLDATVAHVAPHSFSVDDQRYADFVDNKAGGDENAVCRERLLKLQRLLLQHKAEITESLNDADFAILGSKDIGFEHAVIELPFTYWQYFGPSSNPCESIPNDEADFTSDSAFLTEINDPEGYSDKELAKFTPYYFQAATQLGNPGTNLNPIGDLLAHAETYNIFSYVPKEADAHYDNAEAMKDVSKWIAESSEHMLYVYGSFDPWGAGPFEPRTEGESYRFFAPGLNHGTQFNDLKGADRDVAYQKLRSWLNLPAPVAANGAEPKARVRHRKSLEQIEFEMARPKL